MSSRHSWLEITATVSSAQAEAVANRMIELGCSGIVEQVRPAAPGCVVLTGYVEDCPPAARLPEELGCYLNAIAQDGELAGDVRVTSIPDEDWNKKWKSFFEPVKVSNRIVIKPSWRTYRKRPGEVVVELDPGMAFGTGTHPSTGMCLRAIDDLIREIKNPGQAALLDVGTGSGILALAAAGLGVGHVLGIDYDHQAVACAGKNAALNGLADAVVFSTTPLAGVTGFYSLVVANILPHVLIAMRQDLVARMADGAYLVLSGILSKKASEVTHAFADRVIPVRQLHEDEWACLIFRRG